MLTDDQRLKICHKTLSSTAFFTILRMALRQGSHPTRKDNAQWLVQTLHF